MQNTTCHHTFANATFKMSINRLYGHLQTFTVLLSNNGLLSVNWEYNSYDSINNSPV